MNDAGIPESEGEAVDEIVKLAGPIGGMWIAHNSYGICGSGFANLVTFARFREELHDRTGRPAALADGLPDDLYDRIERSFNTGRRDELTFVPSSAPRRSSGPSGGMPPDSARRDNHLRIAGKGDPPSQRSACGGYGPRGQPDSGSDPVSPGKALRRRFRRIRLWPADQGTPVGA